MVEFVVEVKVVDVEVVVEVVVEVEVGVVVEGYCMVCFGSYRSRRTCSYSGYCGCDCCLCTLPGEYIA
ncbi:MAG: hypothetical protein M1528_00410 [Candidatus Marsarchaeota archaeon]|nr:hypothetical protein [Candidatus Marsarchaeota archaeon]